MKIGDYVESTIGNGLIKEIEGEKGTKTERYCVKIEGKLSETKQKMQNIQGGLYFWRSELKLINSN